MKLDAERGGAVYLLGSINLRLYVGVTSDLYRRVHDHKTKSKPGFTSRYNIDRLLWYQQFDDIEAAIDREKEIKKWRREKKLALIEATNPGHVDLAEDWYKIPDWNVVLDGRQD